MQIININNVNQKSKPRLRGLDRTCKQKIKFHKTSKWPTGAPQATMQLRHPRHLPRGNLKSDAPFTSRKGGRYKKTLSWAVARFSCDPPPPPSLNSPNFLNIWEVNVCKLPNCFPFFLGGGGGGVGWCKGGDSLENTLPKATQTSQTSRTFQTL